MKILKYDAIELSKCLIKHKVCFKDTVPVGCLMIFLKTEQGVFKDIHFKTAIPFMTRSSVQRLLNRLDGKIIKIEKDEKDTRVRVIHWLINWSEFVYEVYA